AGRYRLKPSLERQSVAGNDAAGGIRLESAIASISQRAVGHLHLEETVALDRHIELRPGLSQVTGGENSGGGDRPGALPHLDAGWQLIAGGLLRARRAGGLIQQFLKLDLALFVAGGVDVSQVVGDDVQVHLLALHAGSGGVKGSKHSEFTV